MTDAEIVQRLEKDIRNWWASALLTEELVTRLEHAATELLTNDG